MFFSNYGLYLFFRRRVCLCHASTNRTGVMGHRRLETSIAFKGITLRSGLSLRKVHFYLQFRMVTTSLWLTLGQRVAIEWWIGISICYKVHKIVCLDSLFCSHSSSSPALSGSLPISRWNGLTGGIRWRRSSLRAGGFLKTDVSIFYYPGLGTKFS